MDELTNINTIYARKLTTLEALRQHVQRSEATEENNPPDNPNGESADSRIEWAIVRVSDDLKLNKELLDDLRLSLNAVS